MVPSAVQKQARWLLKGLRFFNVKNFHPKSFRLPRDHARDHFREASNDPATAINLSG
jgi:hypothetical protein